jgi:hypothetical protein
MSTTVAPVKILIGKSVAGGRAELKAVQKGIIPAPDRNGSVILRVPIPRLTFYMDYTTTFPDIIE